MRERNGVLIAIGLGLSALAGAFDKPKPPPPGGKQSTNNTSPGPKSGGGVLQQPSFGPQPTPFDQLTDEEKAMAQWVADQNAMNQVDNSGNIHETQSGVGPYTTGGFDPSEQVEQAGQHGEDAGQEAQSSGGDSWYDEE